jgi:hypothetical protein
MIDLNIMNLGIRKQTTTWHSSNKDPYWFIRDYWYLFDINYEYLGEKKGWHKYRYEFKYFKPIYLNFSFGIIRLQIVNFLNDDGTVVKKLYKKSMRKVSCLNGKDFIYSK